MALYPECNSMPGDIHSWGINGAEGFCGCRSKGGEWDVPIYQSDALGDADLSFQAAADAITAHRALTP
ncbi:hypothetical protein [Saccharothrix variisporea]|uniref:Uncharacterized protein n=1 Tax=Saccharothrix variisporea TaxID=543527 RepID=A0A495WZ39_9PSEU|nr:hypothetical protein [Saccharothrix variisporea]RKT67121.1 hypothetical protein DFJ66_0289 [Saccharothrix variisporea]